MANMNSTSGTFESAAPQLIQRLEASVMLIRIAHDGLAVKFSQTDSSKIRRAMEDVQAAYRGSAAVLDEVRALAKPARRNALSRTLKKCGVQNFPGRAA